MIDLNDIHGIIFDYGGTIDSDGMHWAEVIWLQYEAEKVPVDKETFREAYVFAERTMGKNPLVKPEHDFLDMLRIKMHLQLQWLVDNGKLSEKRVTPELAERLAQDNYRYTSRCIDAARPILKELAMKYPLVLVSNFYGNIATVLKDFRLDGIFKEIIESAVVGIRKPDPAIFALGVEKLGMRAEETLVVGDSFDKDIVPSTSLGCHTIWLKGIGWKPYSGLETADVVITSFQQLKAVLSLD